MRNNRLYFSLFVSVPYLLPINDKKERKRQKKQAFLLLSRVDTNQTPLTSRNYCSESAR